MKKRHSSTYRNAKRNKVRVERNLRYWRMIYRHTDPKTGQITVIV